MVEAEKVEEQIGEVLGLEIAAQKAVEEELSLKGLLLYKRGKKVKLKGMKSEAAGHQKKIEKLINAENCQIVGSRPRQYTTAC
jgi:hypothetical protein